jgi:hypothetical protein
MTTDPRSASESALEAASALGRADGRLAVEVEPAGEPVLVASSCHGLDPEGLAALVWGAGAGPAPAGIVLNAPLWYLEGLREALSCARAERTDRAEAITTATASADLTAAASGRATRPGRERGPVTGP